MTFFNSSSLSNRIGNVSDLLVRVLLFIGCLIFPLFTLPFTRNQIDFPKELFLMAITGFCLFLWLLRGAISRTLLIRQTILDYSLIILLSAVLVSAAFGGVLSLSWFGRPAVFVIHVTSFLAGMLWFWLLFQYLKTVEATKLFFQIILLSGILSGTVFLANNFLIKFLPWIPVNPIGQSSSLFGIFMAVIGVAGWGMIIRKQDKWYNNILPVFAAVISFIVLSRIDFTVSWIIFVIGMVFLLILGSILFFASRRLALSLALFSCLLAIFFMVTKISPIAANLPIEVALGAEPSWSISLDAITRTPKTLFLGYGPGNFSYVFSKFRSADFNAVSGIETIRFSFPYSTIFAILSEGGLLVLLIFISILLLHLGTVLNAWRHQFTILRFGSSDVIRQQIMDVGVVVTAWIAVTASFFIAFANISLWWLWWTLLAMSLAILTASLPDTAKSRLLFFEISPQYSLVLSFASVVIGIGIIASGVFFARFYMAEFYFTRAEKIQDLSTAETMIKKALEYRPAYPEYTLSQARVNFINARNESTKTPVVPDRVADQLALAVRQAKSATDADPTNIETWQALSVLYSQARVFSSEANDWARDATQRAIDLEPANYDLYFQLGDIEHFSGHNDLAKDAYRKAISLKNDYNAAYIALSLLYEEEGKIDEAIQVFQPLANNIGSNPELLFYLGRLLYNRNADGDAAEAEKMWLKSVELAPGYSNSLYALGLFYEQHGMIEKAIVYYSKVQSLNPENSEVAKKLKYLQ